MVGRTTRALRRRLYFVGVAVALELIAAAGTTAGHAGHAKKDSAGIAPTRSISSTLRDGTPGFVTGPLGYRVSKNDHGVAQAGHQGHRGAAAKLPAVASSNMRQLLRDAIQEHVVQLVRSAVGDVMVFKWVKQDDVVAEGAALEEEAGVAGSDGNAGVDPVAHVATQEAGGLVAAPE